MKKYLIGIAIIALMGAQQSEAQEAATVTTTTTTTIATTVKAKKPDPYLVPVQGYHGFVAADVNFSGAYGSEEYGVTTTHGVMLTPTQFLGAGAGYMRNGHFGQHYFPIFAEGRVYYPSTGRRIYPHIGARVGVMIASEGGTGYFGQIAGGVRVPVGRNCGLNVEIGPQLMSKYDKATFSAKYKADGTKFGIFARIGFDF